MNEQRITAYVGLGGNMGGEEALFAHARERMAAWPDINRKGVSELFLTQPQDDASQPWFTNQVASLSCGTTVTPEWLLRALLDLESDLGRARDTARRFGPRRIDLDLLLFGDIVRNTDVLTLPHPRMAERAFVLVPLISIAPDLTIPGRGPARACLDALRYTVENRIIYQE